MKKTLATIACLLSLTGSAACKARGASLSPEEYLPLVALSLQSGETAAYIVRNEKVGSQDYQGCVLAETIAGGFGASSEALGSRMQGEIVFPELKVDLTACEEFKPRDYVLTEESAEVVSALTDASLSIAGVYAARLRASDCAKGVAAESAIRYMLGLSEYVLAFMRDPQPVFEYEARSVDFQQCWS